MAEDKIYLGIDWGTHSSKWSSRIEDEEGWYDKLPIYSSNLLRSDGSLLLSPDPDNSDSGCLVTSIKSRLTEDSAEQEFWGTDRPDTRTSLGEAVSFSLCCLLNDAISQMGWTVGSFPIDIGFSFPNWLTGDTTGTEDAVQHFRQAAEVVVGLVGHLPSNCLPLPGKVFRSGNGRAWWIRVGVWWMRPEYTLNSWAEARCYASAT